MKDDIFYTEEYERLNNIKQDLDSYEKIYFYGAGLRSEELIQMHKLGYTFFKLPTAFLVSSMKKNNTQDNSSHIDEFPVLPINEIDINLLKEAAILVVAMDIYHEEIKKTLEDYPCAKIMYLTDAMEHLLTRDFYKYYFEKLNYNFNCVPFYQNFTTTANIDSIHTYSVMCEKDATLSMKPHQASWVSNIQAGARLAKHRVCNIADDTGDSISEKNPYYNELTGLYWVWKNTQHPYTGICHYRRRFESDIALVPIIEKNADVVLPLPFVVYPSLQKYYLNWGEQHYYKTMLEVVNELFPNYYPTAIFCAEGCCFIPNNICIAKREILNDYCEFLFAVIDEVETRMENYSGKKQTRCWLSEHVTTIYFMHHLNDYNVYFSNLIRYW